MGVNVVSLVALATTAVGMVTSSGSFEHVIIV